MFAAALARYRGVRRGSTLKNIDEAFCKNLIRFLLFMTKALNDFPLHIELTLCYLIGKRWRGMLVIRDSW